MRILQVSAEIYPLLKTGGLADIAGALPAALQAVGCDLRVLLPGFPAICNGLTDTVEVGQFDAPWGDRLRVDMGVVTALSGVDRPVYAYVLMAPALFERPGGPYEGTDRRPFGDNHRRFAALGWAAAHLAHGLDSFWRAQLVHSHDWHAGLTPACLAFWGGGQTAPVPSVYTVHNLAYQGVFDAHLFSDLGLPPQALGVQGMEYYGRMSFMKAGLFYADRITTVSPTYAREIQTPTQGCGLDGLLRARSADLSGILNAVDASVWNPANDPLLAHHYDARHMAGKARNKADLQTAIGLPVSPDAPVFAMVSRITEQKGLPLVLGALDEIVSRGGQLVILGNGDLALEQSILEQVKAHPQQIAARIGYDEAFAHLVFAGSDITLVPSLFEPCGLTQMYGLRYGSLPLVRRVGGLADTVIDSDLETLADATATGFVFDNFEVEDYRRALRRAFALYRRKSDWASVRKTGMRLALDWRDAAQKYADLYQSLIQGA
jgi:starch synthase